MELSLPVDAASRFDLMYVPISTPYYNTVWKPAKRRFGRREERGERESATIRDEDTSAPRRLHRTDELSSKIKY